MENRLFDIVINIFIILFQIYITNKIVKIETDHDKLIKLCVLCESYEKRISRLEEKEN